MRCRPGDLAAVIRPNDPRNLGALVRVIELSGTSSNGTGMWACESLQTVRDSKTGIDHPPGTRCYCDDACLRPIRDDPGQDETLRLAGLPSPLSINSPTTA